MGWIETDDIHDLNMLHVYIACINESLKTKAQLDEDVIREMHAQYMCNRAHGDTHKKQLTQPGSACRSQSRNAARTLEPKEEPVLTKTGSRGSACRV